ncbi:GH25 family lysozyme [Weissella paramesenteroides]|uniref:GH25 family lysozyme n=1 Tax=Weissella paramesenteroides TaxID=1249 RepID=UPI002E7AE696|nr:GH25 family lysozyme [Weissella paramesenteroides]WPQ68441.1 GH25 family lysozyme [Weissella paramesenteroides]
MNKFKQALVVAGAFLAFAGVSYVSSDTVSADTPRVDMVDVSNHNGQMTAPEFVYMRNNYGVKAITTKISEGTTFHDYTAPGNIAAAKAAGVYINGYHFLSSTTVSGAIAEADYAVRMAKADGLPTGAVLAVDIENSYQLSMGSAMQPVAKAFENEVMRAGGYRSTTYTGGYSSSVSPAGEKAWLAQYLYDPSKAMGLYSQEHAYQWSSSQTFASSYGRFDVSVLYDNFFTAGTDKDAVVPNVTPSKPVVNHDTSAIKQFKNAGNRFTAYKSFRVDKIAFVNGMWQAINYDLAGGKDASWTANGIPLAMLDNITRGNYAATRVGDMVKFKAGYSYGTIDQYDNASNGAGIVEGAYGSIWYNANSLLTK